MPSACPFCGEKIPERARFCSACGAPIAPAGARQERKFATVLFADLVGSTTLTEREDPEVVQSMIRRMFDRLAADVERHGGIVEKFIGDAVLAVFGIPTAHEDDPKRAMRAALDMQTALQELNVGFVAEGRPELTLRVGIEAGEVFADLERVAASREQMLTGDAVNTAARLQAAAEPGRVVVGPAVDAATSDAFELRALELLSLKGKAEPTPAWEVESAKSDVPGTRTPPGLEARLVGRDEEMAVLEQTFQRVVSDRRPALITILGPAGVGKSRLALELSRHIDSERPISWLTGRCLAYGNVSYSALAGAVKEQCGILEDDSPEVVAVKAAAAVEELFGDHSLAPHLEALVGAGVERAFGRDQLFDTWRRFLERVAAVAPLVLALEDIHWADEGLLDFLDHLADWARGPILVLTLARPELLELRPGWGGGKRNYSAIYLDPLAGEEVAEMLEGLLDAPPSRELTELVIERGEGNPLFTEEIVRMLMDRGALRATDAAGWEIAGSMEYVEVPRSIQAVLAARLDSLPEEEKSILQGAAVVGRVFWLGAVDRLTGWGERKSREVLGRLRVKELVLPREPPTFSGELEFAFRHVLIRDVAYESLPKSLRAERHVEVARWAEEQAGERRDEIAELLATHYAEALRYLDDLGEAMSGAWVLRRAGGHGRRGTERCGCGNIGRRSAGSGWPSTSPSASVSRPTNGLLSGSRTHARARPSNPTRRSPLPSSGRSSSTARSAGTQIPAG